MTERSQPSADGGAFICPEETRNWSCWIDASGLIPKLRIKGEVLVGDPSLTAELRAREEEVGPGGDPVQFFDLSYVEAGSDRPPGDWHCVDGGDVTARSAQPGEKYYEAVIVVCERRQYCRFEDPQPREGRDATGQPSGGGVTGGNSPDSTGAGASGREGIPCPFRDGGARNWDAWLNAMPGPDGKKLIVIGEVHTDPDYAGCLELTHTDRMDPPNQYAELTLVESKGAPGGWQPIRAEQETKEDEFNSVVIGCHGETLVTICPVPVVE